MDKFSGTAVARDITYQRFHLCTNHAGVALYKPLDIDRAKLDIIIISDSN